MSYPLVGERIKLSIEAQAHGGHAVARYGESGLVVFVRHAIPDEVVLADVTETVSESGSSRFLRADAAAVLEPSPDRVQPPCPYAGPGACGGCDFQHVTPERQRALKADVVREQLQRLAGLDVEVTVEPVGEPLRWRSRMRYVALPEGQRGLRVHRSHDVVAVDDCRIEAPGAVVTLEGAPAGDPVVEVVEAAPGPRAYRVAADGFWQPHVDAPRVLVDAVMELARPAPGERVLDLYAGVGLFSAYLAQAVAPAGSVVAVEGDRTASELAEANLDDLGVRVVRDRVDRALHRGLGDFDLVVLDPPRVGAKRQVVRHLAALRPRAVVYVACDPAALARDLGYFVAQGYRLETLRAFDLFPMTSHVECVAHLVKSDSGLR